MALIKAFSKLVSHPSPTLNAPTNCGEYLSIITAQKQYTGRFDFSFMI